MGECRLCGNKGIFLNISQNGLCRTCDAKVVFIVQQKSKIVSDCIRLVNESKNLDTRMSRLALMIKHLDAIEEYEKKGIPTITPLASELKMKYLAMHDVLIEETIRKQFNEIPTRVESGQSLTTINNAIVKILLTINSQKQYLLDNAYLNKLESDVLSYQNKIKANKFIDNAKKAEFKGEKKKAIDQYQEALFLLKNDRIEDAAQKEEIDQITKKLEELTK
jgi:hypothetical protein